MEGKKSTRAGQRVSNEQGIDATSTTYQHFRVGVTKERGVSEVVQRLRGRSPWRLR